MTQNKIIISFIHFLKSIFTNSHFNEIKFQFNEAVKSGDIEIIEKNFKDKLDLIIKSNDKANNISFLSASLMYAAESGHLDMVKLLINTGAEVSAKTVSGWTALMSAAEQGHLEVVQYLISEGADVNAKIDDGWTILMRASDEGHVEVVRLLVENNADVNAKRDSGDTPLFLANGNGDKEISKILTKAGAVEI